MTAPRRRAAIAVLLAVLLSLSAVVGSAGAQMGSGPTDAASSEPADDVYVTDDGDVYLVYESDQDDAADAEFGMSVEEGLVYGLLTDEVEGEPGVTWAFDAVADPTSLTANGTATLPQPDVLESFDLSLTGEATPENAGYDFDVSATTAADAGYGAFVDSITTDGEIVMGADRFTANGTFDARTGMPMGAPSSTSLTFQETDAGYELSAAENRLLSSFERTDWQNRSAAEATIREQYVPEDVDELEGSATLDLESYSLTEAQGDRQRLDVQYTVTYEGIEDALRDRLATELATAPGASESAAEDLADGLFAASVNEVSFELSNDGTATSGSMTVDVSNYQDLAIAYFEYAGSLDTAAATSEDVLEQAQSQFEAQQAADLEQRYTWSGELAGQDDGALALDLTMDYRTTNWATYVDELESRDVPWSESSYVLNGSADGEQIGLNGSLSVQGEDLYEGSLDQLSGVSTGGAATADWGQALAEAEPRAARMNGSYDADGLRVEAGAAFGNLTPVRDAVAADENIPPADEVVARSEGGNGTVHVRVDGAVSGDATESDVRALAYVGEQPTVHLPGDWDREFPSMDADRARSYLGISSDGGIGPGFGPAVALLALAAVAGIALRRRR